MYGDHLDIRARRLRSKVLRRLARRGWADLFQVTGYVTLWFRRLGKPNQKHDRFACMRKVAGKKPKFERLGC